VPQEWVAKQKGLFDQGWDKVREETFARQKKLEQLVHTDDGAKYFGEFGIRGVGYNVTQLREHLVNILGLHEERRVLVVGAGNLGTALSHFSGFNTGGFRIVAILDSDPHKVGKRVPGGLVVESVSDLPRIVKDRKVHIGVITVPASSAQKVYDDLVNGGVQAVLNFAPAQLKGHPEAKLKNVDLKINLELLSFFLTHAARMAAIG